MKRTLKRIESNIKNPSRFVVMENGKEIGLIEKYRDTRTETHPYKAFQGIGMACTFIRSFYPAEGGKDAAIAAIQS
jgi:hypothetical protein